MKDLVVKDQERLSPLRCLMLTIAGIKFRLFRSLVTVAILALAVTFLAHGLAHSLITHETRLLAAKEFHRLRELGEWVARLRSPDTPATIRAHLAADTEPYLSEYRRWTGATPDEVRAARAAARRLVRLEAYFDSLPEASKVILLAGREPVDALAPLADETDLANFAARVREMALPDPPGGIEPLGAFAAGDLAELRRFVNRVQAGHRQAIADVAATIGKQSPTAWFAETGPGVRKPLTDAGFHVDEGAPDRLHAAAENERALLRIATAMEETKVVGALVRRLNVERKELYHGTVIAWLNSAGRAEWLSGLLQRHLPEGEPPAPSAERLLEAAERHRRQGRLKRVVGDDVLRARTGLFDLPRGTRWLMVLSFLVCAVGVTNAMFMSVTERFTEIATMKCLGALDGFLMLMFLFESAMQGLVGAAAGIMLGMLVAVGRGAASFGTMVFAAMPVGDLAICAGLALLAGIVLAVISAVGPAWMVSRLAPMEAMRIE